MKPAIAQNPCYRQAAMGISWQQALSHRCSNSDANYNIIAIVKSIWVLPVNSRSVLPVQHLAEKNGTGQLHGGRHSFCAFKCLSNMLLLNEQLNIKNYFYFDNMMFY